MRHRVTAAMRWGSRVLAVSSMMVFVAPTATAAPPGKGGAGTAKTACLAAHEEAVALRTQKKLHGARDKFVACARVECPTVVRKECVEQLALVEKDAPTVSLEARDEAGMDTTAVKVSMDGTTLVERLTGTGVDVEPGEHVFRFERADGKAIEQRVLVVEGDKNRKVVADFGSLVPKPVPLVEKPTHQDSRQIPVLSYVAGGVAIVALGSFTIFALSGKGAEKDLASSCSPNCKDDELSTVKRDYAIADVSLVVGLVAAAVAVVLAWPAISGSPRTTASIAASRTPPPPWMPRVKVRALP